MKKPIKIILITVGIVAIVMIANLFNRSIHVERTAFINAELTTIQNEITDFRKFETWSPWADVDPNATSAFSENQGSVGAEFKWSGNDQVGTGYQKITAISPERIDLDLVFTAPWESSSKVYYLFKVDEKGTSVTWAYDSSMPLVMSLFMNMDDMIGSKYDKGLASLKSKLEK
jgi:hypothetical protein